MCKLGIFERSTTKGLAEGRVVSFIFFWDLYLSGQRPFCQVHLWRRVSMEEFCWWVDYGLSYCWVCSKHVLFPPSSRVRCYFILGLYFPLGVYPIYHYIIAYEKKISPPTTPISPPKKRQHVVFSRAWMRCIQGLRQRKVQLKEQDSPKAHTSRLGHTWGMLLQCLSCSDRWGSCFGDATGQK